MPLHNLHLTVLNEGRCYPHLCDIARAEGAGKMATSTALFLILGVVRTFIPRDSAGFEIDAPPEDVLGVEAQKVLDWHRERLAEGGSKAVPVAAPVISPESLAACRARDEAYRVRAIEKARGSWATSPRHPPRVRIDDDATVTFDETCCWVTARVRVSKPKPR